MTQRLPSRVLHLLLATVGLQAQQPEPAASDPAAIQPPALPANAAPPAPAVLPPAPGEIKAAPAPALPALPGLPPTPPSIPSAPSAPPLSTAPVPGGGISSVPLPRARPASSTSTSGQFIVHGDTLPLRSAFSSKCEDIAASLRKILHDKEPWSIPVVVLLSTGEAAAIAQKPVATTISQLAHGGFHIQVTIHLRPDLRQADAHREIIRALLAERILRGKKQITAQRPLLLPDWLFTGILEALEYRARTRPSALFAAIFQSGKIYSIEEIIEAVPDRLDGLSKTIYEVSCCALVLALLDLPDGGPRMAAFLSALATDPRPERQLLDASFPAIATTSSSLNKWWSIQLATLAAPSMAEPLSIEESLQELRTALTFQFRARPSELPRRPAEPALISTSQDKTEEPPAPDTSEEITTPSPRRGLFSRLNPFSRDPTDSPESGAQDADSVIAAALEQAALNKLETDTAPVSDSLILEDEDDSTPRRSPLLSRLLRRKRPTPQENEPASENATPSETVSPVPNPPEKADDATPPRNRLNPLNWFRRSDDDAESGVPAGDTPSVQLTLPNLSHLPALWLHPLSLPPVLAQSFLGIRFGKKKEDPEESAPPQAPAPTSNTEKPSNEAASEAAAPTLEPSDKANGETERRSKLNPLNWFRKGGPDSEAKIAPEESSAQPEESPPSTATNSRPPLAAQPSRSTAPESGEPTVQATLPLEDYALLLKRKDAKTLLEANILALASLQNRAHVALRPIIADYSLLLSDLHQGRTKNADARIRELRARTRLAETRARELRAMLDLHEANTPHYLSGAFEDYLQLPLTLKKELPERTDPISRYLDSLDREFSANAP